MIPSTEHAPPLVAAAVGTAAIAAGVWLLVVLDLALAQARPLRAGLLLEPFRGGARLLAQEVRRTEVPDTSVWLLGPALVLVTGFMVLSVVPLAPGAVGAELGSGLLFFQGMLALVAVGVFLTGWGPNSPYPLVGGYRMVAQYLAWEMPFIMAVITVGLTARSLDLADVVSVQAGLWNVALQPIGFLVYLVAGLAISFWGPLALPQGRDLAGGVAAELAGAHRLVWLLARWVLLLTVSVFAVPLFLGGWLGPVLPPVAWTVVKALAVAALLVYLRGRVARVSSERFASWSWTVLLPLAFFNLFLTGVVLLAFPRSP